MGEPENTEEFVKKYGWMIRPCDSYNSEYVECAGIKARLHQLYIFGETLDCAHWKSNYRDCNNVNDKKDLEAAKRIILFEQSRREARIKSHYANDVWEHRVGPPENWNCPLPEWMEEKYKESFLYKKQQEIEANPKQIEIDANKWCRLM